MFEKHAERMHRIDGPLHLAMARRAHRPGRNGRQQAMKLRFVHEVRRIAPLLARPKILFQFPGFRRARLAPLDAAAPLNLQVCKFQRQPPPAADAEKVQIVIPARLFRETGIDPGERFLGRPIAGPLLLENRNVGAALRQMITDRRAHNARAHNHHAILLRRGPRLDPRDHGRRKNFHHRPSVDARHASSIIGQVQRPRSWICPRARLDVAVRKYYPRATERRGDSARSGSYW